MSDSDSDNASTENKPRFKAKKLRILKQVFKEFEGIPVRHRNTFMRSLEAVQYGLDPFLKITHLESGAIELKINGSPAFRCIYYTKLAGEVVVVHVTAKTTNGHDSQIANVVKERIKTL
ncbi:type II toxin-antitoxin system RelE/ParE family toxin [Pseudomonas marginalis]|uniref:type II toxin-antitoxin system RelE/ParE family toxin n=1 Tax=Pseudomonas marginalis TaxID=298 RepID=UPI00203389AD|nr:type II toxin-antitoxin system RelE/ParE family toxin [Pseudomonas marginalis]MCM2377865.1 type II toxin-antitoxin system RelE/ParE family toxin [Pseudomonas marginalis]